MALARRLAVALVALVGLALTVVGAWFALILGPKGTASFTATSNQPTVLLGSQVLNRVNVPVTVTATAPSGPVFLGAAVPQDATQAVGQARHNDAIAVHFPARSIDLEGFGGEPMPDPSGYHVWRTTGEGAVTLAQDAPSAVVVYATKGGPVDVTVSYARGAWFLQSIVGLVVGLILLAFAGGWLWQQLRPATQDPGGGAAEHVGPEQVAATGRTPTQNPESPESPESPEQRQEEVR